MNTKITYRPISDMSILKVGDIVYVDTTYDLRPKMTAKIMRFTKTMIICNDIWGHKVRYNRKDGVEVGHGIWHHPTIIGIVISEEPVREYK